MKGIEREFASPLVLIISSPFDPEVICKSYELSFHEVRVGLMSLQIEYDNICYFQLEKGVTLLTTTKSFMFNVGIILPLATT